MLPRGESWTIFFVSRKQLHVSVGGHGPPSGSFDTMRHWPGGLRCSGGPTSVPAKCHLNPSSNGPRQRFSVKMRFSQTWDQHSVKFSRTPRIVNNWLPEFWPPRHTSVPKPVWSVAGETESSRRFHQCTFNDKPVVCSHPGLNTPNRSVDSHQKIGIRVSQLLASSR